MPSKGPKQFTINREERTPSVDFLEPSIRDEKSRELYAYARGDEQSFIELTLKEAVKIRGLDKSVEGDKSASTSQVESIKGLEDRIENLISAMKGTVLNG